ncbi:hypothetical protein VPNG_05027 [Cytospora leucostoma]|uniref:MARVEL domain-containing protein n=1 Tax=Cytospora leucostoma TaxID=1230097 RepID=A0A423X7G3_9PEZI|nr:hypothetical protein VPNG_05027 [Cytospora leucostoma]
MRTGFRDHGFHGHAFVGSRLLSLIALFAIIGLVTTFMIESNHAELTAPQQLTSTIIISGCALLWVFLSFAAYDDTHIPYISTAIIDAVFLIPFSVAAVVLGRPVSQKDCSTLLKESGNETTTTLTLLFTNTSGNGTATQLSYDTLLGTDQITCFKLKATWGLMVALCILFVFSAFAISFIFLRKRRNGYGRRGATKRDWAWWNIWRLGEGRQKRGHQPTKTWTNVNVNNMSGISGLASDSSNNTSSTRNINKNNQALKSSSSKNNKTQSSSHSSSSAPGRWNFGFGRLWRKGGGGVDQSAKNRNLQGGYALTDSSKRHNKNDKDVPNANFNPGSSSRVMDFGDQQRKKNSGFFSLFRSKDKDKSNTTPALPNGQRPPQQPYAQNQAANSSRSRIVDNQKGPAPLDGTVNGRTGRPGPGIAGQGRDPNSSSSKGTIPKALDSTKYGDKNVPTQRKKVNSPLTKNPVTSSAAPGGRLAERSKGPAVSDANNRLIPGSTKSDRNGPNSGLNMKGKLINTIPGARSSPGATNGNHTQEAKRNLGLQRPGMAHRGQSPARNVAAAYRPQGDIRRPAEPTSSARDAIKLVWNGTGSNNFEKPAHGQPLPHNDNGRHQKTVQEKVVTKNDSSARLGGGLFSREKNSSNSKINTEQGLPHNNINNPGKKSAAPSANSHNPQINRNLSAAEASYLSTPLNPAVQETTGRGKTHAEKKGESENKPRVEDLPVNKPHGLETQQRPFNAGAGAAGGVPPQKNGHTQQSNLLHPGPVRTAEAGRTSSPGRVDMGRPLLREKATGHEVHKNDAPATQNGKSGRLLEAHHLSGHHGPDAKSDAPRHATPGYLDKGKNVALQAQGPSNPQDTAPAQITAASLPMRDAKAVHPAPQRPGERDLAGGGRPKFEQRERPVIIQVPPSSREQRGVPDGVASDRKRGGAGPFQRSAVAEVARTLSPGRNPRDISRDGRGQPTPSPRALNERAVPVALAFGPQGLQQPAKVPKDANGRRQPSPPGKWSLRPSSPQESQGRGRSPARPNIDQRPSSPPSSREQRPEGPITKKREQLPNSDRQPSPSRARPVSPSTKGGHFGQQYKREDIALGDGHPQDKNGPSLPPSASISGFSTERGRGMPQRGVNVANELLQLPPSIKDTPMTRSSSPSRPGQRLEDRQAFVSRDGLPLHDERGLPARLGASGEPVAPPPFLRNPAQGQEPSPSPGMTARMPEHTNGQHIQSRGSRIDEFREPNVNNFADVSRGDRMPRPANKPLTLDPHAPPTRDGQNNVRDERDELDRSNASLGPRQAQPTTGGLLIPLNAPVDDPRGRPSTSRGPQQMNRPLDRQHNLPSEMKAEGSRGRAPPLSSLDPHRGHQQPDATKEDQRPAPSVIRVDDAWRRSTSPISHELNDEKGQAAFRTAPITDKTKLATLDKDAPGAAESSQKPSIWTSWMPGSKKNKKLAQTSTPAAMAANTAIQRPSLLPPGRGPKSLLPTTTEASGQSKQRGHAHPPSLPQENTGVQQEEGRPLIRQPISSSPDGLRRPSSSSSSIEQINHLDMPVATSDGQQRLPGFATAQDQRGRFPPFPTRAGQKNESDMPQAVASSRNQNLDQAEDLDIQPIPEARNVKKANRKSRVTPGMVPIIAAGEEPLPPPPFPTSPTTRDGGMQSAAVDMPHMPPMPVLDDYRQKRVSNRKSRVLPGSGPLDFQMPPMPPMPEQAPIVVRRDPPIDDGRTERKPLSRSSTKLPENGELFRGNGQSNSPMLQSSSVPLQLRPGGPQGDVAAQLVGQQLGKQKEGFPPRTTSRGLNSKPLSPAANGITMPQPPSSEAQESLRYDPMADDLKPGRPSLKLQIEKSREDQVTAVSDVPHIPPPISAIMGSGESHTPSGLDLRNIQLGKEKEQEHRQPLSLCDGNTSPRYTVAADKDLLVFKATGLPVPPSQMPDSLKTNKLQAISGKGDDKGKYPDAESPLQDMVPSTPPPRYSWVENGRDTRPKDMSAVPAHQDGQLSMSQASRVVEQVGVGHDGQLGPAVSNPQVEDNKGISKDKELPLLSNASGHNKESDTTPGVEIEGVKKTGFLGSLFGGKDTLSPIGPPITKDAAPWLMEQDQNVSGKKNGMAWSVGDKKVEKQRRGSRDWLTNPSTNNTGSIKPWSTSGDQLGETSHHEEKAGFLEFGNKEPKQETHSPWKGDEELFDYGVGKDKNQQPRSPGASPTSSTGGDDFFLERYSTKTDFAYKEDFDEQKPGSLSNGKSKGGSPAGSPALQNSSSSSPRLDLWSTRENMGVESSNDCFGSFNNLDKIKNQRRGSSSQPLSPEQVSLRLKPANGDVERSALEENKRGLFGLFGKDKEKQKRRGSQSQPMSPNKHASPDESLKSMETQQPDLDQPVAMPAVLDLQEQQHPGSQDKESGLFFGKSGNKDIAQPLPEDNNHLDNDAPISPNEDYNDIMDMYQTTAIEPESEPPMLQDFSESPRRYLDDDRLDSAEPEKPKPAPLTLKEKWKNLFNKAGSATAGEDNFDASEKDSHPESLDDFESSGRDDHGASGMGIGPSQYDLGENPAQNNFSPPAADVGMPMESDMLVESDLPMGSPTQPVSSDFELPDTDTPEPPVLGSTAPSEDRSEPGPAPHHQADETPEPSFGADEGNFNNEPIPLASASEPSFGLESDDMAISVPPPKDLPNGTSGITTPMNENPVAESVSETGESGLPDMVTVEQVPGPIVSPALMSDNLGDSSFEPVPDHDAPHADDCLIDTDASDDMSKETSTELPSPVNEAPSAADLAVEPPAHTASPQVDEMDMDGMHIPSQDPDDDFSPPLDGSGDVSQMAEEPLMDHQPTTSGFGQESFEPAPESQDPVVGSHFEPVLIDQNPIEPPVGGDDSPMDTDDSRDIPMETGMGLPADSGASSPPEEDYIEPDFSEPAPDVSNSQEDVMDDGGEPGFENPPVDDVIPPTMDEVSSPSYDDMPPMDDDVPMGDELPLNEALPVDDQMPIDDDPPPTDDVYEEVQILDGDMDLDMGLENEGFPVASPEEPLQGDLIEGSPEESPENMPAELGEGNLELGEDFTEEPPQEFTEELPQYFAEEPPQDDLGGFPAELPREDLLEGSPECIDEGNVGEDEQAEIGEEDSGEGDRELGYGLDSQEPEQEAFDCDEEQPQEEEKVLDGTERREERGFDDELTGRDVEEDEETGEEQLEDEVDGGSIYEVGVDLEEKESRDEPDEEEEEDGELDDEELAAIMSDDILASPTDSDYGRGIASSSTEEHPAETSDDPAQDGQPTEPGNSGTVRLSHIYRQSAVFSPLPSATPPPSPPPEEEDDNVQPNGELEHTDPIRYSHLYRQSIDLDMAFSMDSPTSDSGLSAIAESPDMGPVQTFDVPILAPVPDFAKRRSQRTSARMSTMSQPLSPIAASPLSPRPPPSPPLEADEDYDQQHHYDSSDYDLERGLSPVEDIYQNYYDEDDEYEPQDGEQLDHGSGLRGGPQTFDDMKLSPRPGSGLGSVSAQGLGIISPPPPPLPYDSGRYVAEPGSPSSFV